MDLIPSAEPSLNGSAPEIHARLIDKTGEPPFGIGNLLSQKEQEELRPIARLVDYPRAGTTIFSAGGDADFVYVVDAGIVRISRLAESGQRHVLAFMMAGDLFGMPDGGLYANSSETVCPARVYRFPWQKLRRIMTKEPQLQLNLLTKLAYDFRRAQRQMVILSQQTTYQRLALFLLDFMRIPGFFDAQHSRLNLPVNRFDLADYLGMTRETAARAFARLEDEGLIRRADSHTIEILSMNGLKQLHRGRPRKRAAAQR
jgi:CRP-like cAMP-binding protein